ncbi:MAG: uracil-DNA glycosylase [Campylobacteraceae bacterium]|jgi:uracil-DNA glycosylase|nr:uracil-DNA glycosylase [Campylobacteraceae bacterium]
MSILEKPRADLSVHESWRGIIENAYGSLDMKYREFLENSHAYFPDFHNFLNAFKTLPRDKTKSILFGQDPYPRKESATGYAFIDKAVKTLFSDKGLSREVNRATSLRNFIKMLLLASNYLKKEELTQENIARLDKKELINSIHEWKNNFEKEGVLLLNSALVFTKKEDTKKHAKAFAAFMRALLGKLKHENIELILLGSISKEIEQLLPQTHNFRLFYACHPYNIKFITDKKTLDRFSKMELLKRCI